MTAVLYWFERDGVYLTCAKPRCSTRVSATLAAMRCSWRSTCTLRGEKKGRCPSVMDGGADLEWDGERPPKGPPIHLFEAITNRINSKWRFGF